MGSNFSIPDLTRSGSEGDDFSQDTDANPLEFIPETLFLSWETNCDDLEPGSSTPENSLRHFTSFDDVLKCVFCPIRYLFSAGWLLNAQSFYIGYEKFDASNSHQPYIHQKKQTGLSSQKIAQIVRDRLIGFGWGGPNLAYLLDQCGYGMVDKKGRNTAKSLKLDRDGIQILDLDCCPLTNENKLNINDISIDRLPLHYSSSHPIDRALLAIEYTGYGNRSLRNDRMPLDNYFLLQLPQSAIGVLSGIMPSVSTKIVTYRQPDAAARISANIDRLVRLYRETPDDCKLGLTIKGIIKHIIYLSVASPPIQTDEYESSVDTNPFHDTLILERLLSECIGDGINKFTHAIYNESCGIQSSFDLIHALAATGEGPALDTVLAALHACSQILGFDTALMNDFSDVINDRKSNKDFTKLYKAIDRALRDNQDLFSDLPFASKSHMRPLTIMRYIAKFMHSIMQHDVVVHEKLQKWISENFKFIWLVPHDPTSSLRESLTLRRGKDCIGESERDKNFVFNISNQNFWEGHFRSSNFNILFSHSPVEGSIEVDVKPIIEFGMKSLKPSDERGLPGWLFTKISETSILLDELTARIGYCSDFELKVLLHVDQFKYPHMTYLEVLSTSTIMRCVVSQDGGENLLRDWCQLLLNRYNAHLNEAKLFHKEIIDMTLQPQRVIFQDVYGMVGAAIDCCRNMHTSCTRIPNDSIKAYFRPEICLKYYNMRDFYDQKASWKTASKKAQEKHKNSSKLEMANPYQSLLRFMSNPKYSSTHALELVDIWLESAGLHFGESVDHLFIDIREDLGDSGVLDKEISMRLDYLLKEFHTRSGTMS